NIDTGLGLERMAVIQQGVDTVFETDTFAPLMALGRELASSEPDERALRILADHSRAMTFLVADGVVPSNEARGYILRRIMRSAPALARAGGLRRRSRSSPSWPTRSRHSSTSGPSSPATRRSSSTRP